MDDIQDDNTIDDNIDDEFEGRLNVSFTLTGKDLIPDDITTKLGVDPSFSFQRGDFKTSSNGTKHIREHGCWSIDSENKGLKPGDPIPPFEWLLSILEPVKENLEEILTNKNIRARVSCFWITPDGRINVEVEPELLARLANLNLRIWFDIYCNH